MTSSMTYKLMMVVAALGLATSAFAGTTHRGSLQVYAPVQVNGHQVAAGNYQVRWEGDGPNVQLTILKGKNVVATSPAHMVDLNTKAVNDAALIKNNSDGSRSLSQVRFAGKKAALELGEESAQSMKSDEASK
ncbi:MAG TPA: hypothetical protein VFI95_03300 [Terriglobales bacterium]|nr:hypothetical protein [Terriglobales bacterium]